LSCQKIIKKKPDWLGEGFCSPNGQSDSIMNKPFSTYWPRTKLTSQASSPLQLLRSGLKLERCSLSVLQRLLIHPIFWMWFKHIGMHCLRLLQVESVWWFVNFLYMFYTKYRDVLSQYVQLFVTFELCYFSLMLLA